MQGYVQIHRQIVKWERYTDIPVKVLFFHLILIANHQDNKRRGVIIKKGQVLTSTGHLSRDTGLSIQQVRTSLEKLENTKEVTRKATNKYTIITIMNWEKYQIINKGATSKPTNKQQTNNKQITTNNNDNNVDNDNNTIYAHFENSWKEYNLGIKLFEKSTGLTSSIGSKKKASESRIKYNPDIDQTIKAIKAYTKEHIRTRQYMKNYVTWLNQGGYDQDWGDSPITQKEAYQLAYQTDDIAFFSSRLKNKYGDEWKQYANEYNTLKKEIQEKNFIPKD